MSEANGAADGIRTHDLLLDRELLSTKLSYDGKRYCGAMFGAAGEKLG